ncbi:MAG: hypothetical protein QXT39_00160 [Conexivisphaerales archaeon]
MAGNGSHMNYLRWLQFLVISLTAATVLGILPLPALRVPGQSYLIVLSPSDLLFYGAVLSVLTVYWLKSREFTHVFVATLSFLLIYFSFWQVHSVNSQFMGSAWNYASLVLLLTHEGHFPALVSGQPGSFIELSFIYDVTGTSIGFTFKLFELWRILIISILIFLVAFKLVKDQRSASLITMLTASSAVYLIRLPDSPFSPNGFSDILFFALVLVLLDYALYGKQQGIIILLVMIVADTVTYLGTSMVTIAIILTGFVIWKRKPRIASDYMNYNKSMTSLFLFSLIAFFAFYGLQQINLLYVFQNWLGQFIHSVVNTTTSYHFHYFNQRLFEYIGSQPTFLAGVVVFWLTFVYAVGFIVWTRTLLKKPSPFIKAGIGVLMFAVALFTLQGGSEEARALAYIPIIFTPPLVVFLGKIRKNIVPALAILAIILTVPTAVAYYPAIGFNTAYDSNIAAGGFIAKAVCTPELFSEAGVVLFNYTLFENTYSMTGNNLLFNNNGTGYIALNYNNFLEMGTCHLFNPSFELLQTFEYAYGNNVYAQMSSAVLQILNRNSVIYSNGYNWIVAPK